MAKQAHAEEAGSQPKGGMYMAQPSANQGTRVEDGLTVRAGES